MSDAFERTANYISSGVAQATRNAVALCKDAKLLLDAGSYPRCLSLSVLAIEEVGKIVIIDSLVFAAVGDERAKGYVDGFGKHRDKLNAAAQFPLAIPYFFRFDTSRRDRERVREACAIGLRYWSQAKKRLMHLLGEESHTMTQWTADFTKLNRWKQAGFYVDQPKSGDAFVSPGDVSRDLAESTYDVAWRMADGLNFLLSAGTSHYAQWIERARRSLGIDGAKELREHVNSVVTDEIKLIYKALRRRDE